MVRESRKQVRWLELPFELVLEIERRLKFQLDVLRLRSVCKLWRSYLLSNTKTKHVLLPLVIPQPPILNPHLVEEDSTFFLLSEQTLYAIRDGLGGNWLVEFDEVRHKRFIPHYMFKNACVQFHFFKSKNMVDMSVFPIYKYYHIVHVTPKEGEGGFFDWRKLCNTAYNVVRKTVVMSIDDGNYNDSYLLVSALLDKGSVRLLRIPESDVIPNPLLDKGSVRLLRIPESDVIPNPQEWRVITCDIKDGKSSNNNSRFDDIVEFEGKLCAVDCKGRALIVNMQTLEQTVIAKEAPAICNIQGLARRRRLVVDASGRLHLLIAYRVVIDGEVKPGIKVYRLWKQRKEWVEVESIGDEVFVVGYDFSFGVSARDVFMKFEEYQNCILVETFSFPQYNRCRHDCPEYNTCRHDHLFEDMEGGIGVYNLPHGSDYRVIPLFNMYGGDINYFTPPFLTDERYRGHHWGM